MTSTMLGSTTPANVAFGHIEPCAVHFDDLDAIAMLHNARYAVLLERAVSTFFAANGHGWAGGSPSNPDMVAAVREFTITYHVPVRGTGHLDVHFWIEKLGGSSAVYGFRFLSPDHTVVYAEGRRVMVKLDPRTGRPSPWTEDGRALATRLLREESC